MKIFVVIAFSLTILLTLGIALFTLSNIPRATIGDHTFYVEVAKTSKEQEIGLAKYTSLPKNKAMYFPFEKPDYYSFWMKNMSFPIDILFIREGKIVTIFSSVPVPGKTQTNLPTYQPSTPADSVLEINAGLSKKYGLRTGNYVQISN